MTDTSNQTVRAFAPPRERMAQPEPERVVNSLSEILGRHVEHTNANPSTSIGTQVTNVQAIACALKELTYDEAQEVGNGLAAAIDANADKDKSFDFSNLTVKLAPTLTHLIQTWASTVKATMQKAEKE